MELNERIASLRRQARWSQDQLAELLGVSRQAVSQWETGDTIPDLAKVVDLGRHFGISLDWLAAGQECRVLTPAESATPTIGPPGLPVAFLCRAKRATYAGHGAETTSSRLKSHDLAYEEPGLVYYDTYLGGERFAGEEALWVDLVPIWSMNYVGRVLEPGFSGDFLRQALALVEEGAPFRGPGLYRVGEHTYHCRWEGDLSWFQGQEEIYWRDGLVYEARFHGGALR